MNAKLLNKLSKGLFIGFSTLLAVLSSLYGVAAENSGTISEALGARTFIIKKGDRTGVDTEYFKFDYSDPDTYRKAAEEFCRRLESEGAVLLKNDGALPLRSGAKVSMFAQGAVKPNYSATGSSSSGAQAYDSFKTALESVQLSVNPTLWDWYMNNGKRRTDKTDGLVKTYTVNEAEWSAVKSAAGNTLSAYGDAAIVVFSRDSGEGYDVSVEGSDGADGTYLSLTKQERDLLKGLAEEKAAGNINSIVVLLNSAVPIELDFLKESGITVDACMWIGNLGMTGAYGVADVLSGKVNPSGRLSDTYCADNLSSPAMASWQYNENGLFSQLYQNYSQYSLGESQRYYAVYNEGIYVGYRYYETRYEDYVTGRDKTGAFDYSSVVAYPFGSGLSYTTFSYSDYNVTENEAGDGYNVTLTVNNTGKVEGREVVQIYLQKPYDPALGIEQSAVELVGFAKTGPIAAGGETSVTIEVDKEAFRSYDADENKTYVLAPGSYYLTAAHDAHDAVNNILAAKGHTVESTEGRMTADGDVNLVKEALNQGSLDTQTYSKSSETDKPITNLLDFADINKYENRGNNSVTYASRADWEGTWPKSNIALTVANQAMADDLASHKPLPEDGPQAPVYNQQNGLNLIMLRGRDYNDDAWDKLLNQMTYEDQSMLLSNAAFGTKAVNSVNAPGTSANDGPTGVKNSITGTAFPSEGIWASSFDVELIEEVGSFLAEDCHLNGMDALYAPGINIHRTPFGGRAHEYFSEDPYLTGVSAVAEVTGLQKKGVVAVLKHLAFNDAESARNGIGVWLNEQAAREIYLRPFEIAMRPSSYGENAAMGAAGTMSSFNRVGTIWTGASSALQQQIGRDEWNYMGYYITDMASANGAQYMTYDDGIYNGTDLFLGSGSKTALRDWRNNDAYKNRVREATHRVLYVIANNSSVMNGVEATDEFIVIMPWWQVTLITLIAVSAFVTCASAGLYIALNVKDMRKNKS